MKHLKLSLIIFLSLAFTRFLPHPPNFTSLIALSFYIPVIFGLKYISIVFLSFIVTDIFIGNHNFIFFTWSSVLIIGFITKYFKSKIFSRVTGAIIGALIFYILTNFGVWLLGGFEYNIEGLILCYTLALPFFGYSVISTIFFSLVIEIFIKIFNSKTALYFKI